MLALLIIVSRLRWAVACLSRLIRLIDAKRGQGSTLAIASEQGTLELVNTRQRPPWEPGLCSTETASTPSPELLHTEPPRTVITAHSNAVLDIAWSSDDTNIATASGDHTAKIFCPQSQALLHTLQGHTSTLKCVKWNPNHRDLLTTAGRDGCIMLWDLRQPTKDGRLGPMLSIEGAHDPRAHGHAASARNKGRDLSARSVTSVVYLPASPQHLISSGSNDG